MTTEVVEKKPNTISANVLRVRWDQIRPDPDQPRKVFDPQGIEDLAQSIGSNGLLQPIAIRPDTSGHSDAKKYIIIAGERRWRAVGNLGWQTIPAIIRKDLTDQEAAMLQLLENIARKDLNPVEEARALQMMLDRGSTMKELGAAIGIAPSAIPWRIQMLNVRDDVLHLVSTGVVKASVAYEVSLLSPGGQARALKFITNQRLSYSEVLILCAKIRAEENQTDMFPENILTQQQIAVIRTFGASFKGICSQLAKLHHMEEEQPGSIARLFSSEGDVLESQLDEAIKGLNRIKKVALASRVSSLVESDVADGN